MSTLYATVGLPGSGKTTKAKEMLVEQPNNLVRVNSDDIRAMSYYKWTPKNEEMTNKTRDFMICQSLSEGNNVIVDNTNLHPKHIPHLKNLADAHAAGFELIDFTHVGLNECIDRDSKRPNPVGTKVIFGMWEKYLKPKPVPRNKQLPDIIICDIDGTVALKGSRNPFDETKVIEDKPRYTVIDALHGLVNVTGARPVYASGRHQGCQTDTRSWLNSNVGYETSPLFMRADGDNRHDYIVKREIYEREIKDRYNVVAILDDRPQVIRMWQELGFYDRIFNVGDGHEF